LAENQPQRLYQFMMLLGLILSFVTLLVGYYLDVKMLQAMSITYFLCIISGYILFATGKLPPAQDHLLAFTFSLLGLALISMGTFFLAKTFECMGVYQLTTWPTTTANQNDFIIGFGSIALTLNVNPAVLTSMMLQLPTGVGEESFFRVFLIENLKPVMGPNSQRIASGVVFGFVHYLAYQAQAYLIISASLSGWYLAFVYQKFHSPPGIAAAHFVWNIAAIGISVFAAIVMGVI
jgi:membrane protease YdiL (CAAX protease family)